MMRIHFKKGLTALISIIDFFSNIQYYNYSNVKGEIVLCKRKI